MLLDRAGDVVMREELRQALWPSDTFVDFDVGVDAAIYKLRQALGDTAENPRFIETLARRGYRFIAPVEAVDAAVEIGVRDRRNISQEGAAAVQPAPETRSVVNITSFSRQEVVDHRFAQVDAKPRTRLVASGVASVLLVVVAILAWFNIRHSAAKSSSPAIVVLPFKDLAPKPGNDYFADALTDEVIRNLSVIEGLQVRSRTSSFVFKDTPRDVRSIGEQLNVNFVLEGSVLREANRLRINVQLVRVADDTSVWSGRYDRDLKDIFDIQDEISRSIVSELRLTLRSGRRRYNANLQAYEQYLQAQAILHAGKVGPHPEGIVQGRRALELLNGVIAQQADFALAYAGVAYTYLRMSQSPRAFEDEGAWRGLCHAPATCREEVATAVRNAATKSLQMDSLLAEGHAIVGIIHARDRAWSEAETAFRRAIELNPNLAEMRAEFALTVLLPLGRIDEALQQARAAMALDPLSPRVRNVVDLLLVSSGRYKEALARCSPMPAAVPDTISQQLCARALLQTGKLNDAISLLEQHEALGSGGPGFLAYAYARAGRREDAQKVVAKYPRFPWVHALAYAGLADKDRTFLALNRMVDIDDSRVAMYLAYPELALLRGDPRLAEFRRRLNLAAVP
jgi:TolB-like protein/DNA-binding winged helix-turn-helix (wHTH) protein